MGVSTVCKIRRVRAAYETALLEIGLLDPVVGNTLRCRTSGRGDAWQACHTRDCSVETAMVAVDEAVCKAVAQFQRGNPIRFAVQVVHATAESRTPRSLPLPNCSIAQSPCLVLRAAFWQYFGASPEHLVPAFCFAAFASAKPQEIPSIRAYLRSPPSA
jgi:hypothetical protein